MRYLLNSAVITAPGTYTYRLVDEHEARDWVNARPVVSTIGYQETAEALSLIAGRRIGVCRLTIKMEVGDEALVFRLSLPPGEARVDHAAKGRLSVAFVLQHAEIGVLSRVA